MAKFSYVQENFLTPEECIGFIDLSEKQGYEEAKIQRRGEGEVMNKDVRDNDRVFWENPQVAAQMFELIKEFIPQNLNEDFEGGTTMLITNNQVITPKTGMLLLFDHKILHAGLPVTSGTKYVLRTDVMYRLTTPIANDNNNTAG